MRYVYEALKHELCVETYIIIEVINSVIKNKFVAQ